MNKNILYFGAALAMVALSSCENQDVEFDDFDYQTVYFANQYPARTLELGEDPQVDTSLDNLYKINIKATMGGAYSNKSKRTIDFVVDNTLCDGLYFAKSDEKITPMPAEYYTLASNQIIIPKGSVLGGVEVQLTDKFFEDEKCIDNYYVIPLKMTAVHGADSILQGKPAVDDPDRFIESHWTIKPKDYVLYGVKYVNPWHGEYLRRGVDIVNIDSQTETVKRHATYVEKDEVVNVVTGKLKVAKIALSTETASKKKLSYDLVMTFDENGNCNVSSNNEGIKVTGTGKFVSKGEKNSIGGKDRDALYLDYKVENDGWNLETKDTLVLRNRGVSPEYFSIVKK